MNELSNKFDKSYAKWNIYKMKFIEGENWETNK